MYGYKWKDSYGNIHIQVKGFQHMTYMWYSQREAEQKYRAKFGLRYKHIEWL